MNDMLQLIHDVGIVPVIKITDPNTAVPLAKALDEGGIPVAEVTFRTEHAAEAIRRINREVPSVLTGAGTVTTLAQVDAALEAGAKFIVTPGFNPKIVDYCLEKKVPIVPGAPSTSDIEQAIERGLEVVKCFPAEALGGLKYIKAICGPYSGVQFMPTGGVNPANINSYLAFNRILACGGSWMIDQKLIDAGDYAGIATLCREAVDTVLGIRFAHIGLNDPNSAAAKLAAEQFAGLMGAHAADDGNAFWPCEELEVLPKMVRGQNGHIAFWCNNMERAVYQLTRRGYEFSMEETGKDPAGHRFLFLKGEMAGFSVHLLER